jgi:hypothetical protein
MKAYRNVLLVLATLILALALSLVALAEPPAPGTAGVTLAGIVASKISYQGRLTDAGGNPLNGTYNLVFQLWNDATAGSQVGSDIVRNGVPVSNGLFTVDLDVPQEAFNGQALWLRIQVGGQWLSPRQELLPVPYALGLRPGARIEGDSTEAVASVVNQGLGVALYAQGAGMGVEGVGMTGVHGQGQVGVGGEGLTGVSGAGSWVGVYGESAGGYGVRGNTGAPMTATVAGVYGSGDNSIGVMGTSITGTGGSFASTHGTGAYVETLEGYGLYVQSGDNIGIYAHSGRWTHPIYWFGHIGVFGNAEEGVGVQGMGQTGGYFSGQQGVRASGTMTGVTGTADNMGGRGVAGFADNYSGIGVYGSGGFGVGVQGDGTMGVKGVSSVGPGVWGEGATGVWGQSQGGAGVYGQSTSGYGVQGQGPTGVYGRSDAAGGQGIHGYGTANLTEGVIGTADGPNGAGVYARAAGSGWLAIGVQADSVKSYGMYGNTDVAGGYGFYTPDKIYAGGGCVGCTSMLIAKNGGEETLEPGDVVVVTGITAPLSSQATRPAIVVRKADAASSQAVVGVVEGRYVFELVSGQERVVEGARTTEEPAAPGEYLTVVYRGLARVKVDARSGAIKVGDPLTIASASYAVPARAVDAASGNVIGKAMEPLATGQGLIWVLVDMQ